ncbi:hypothetical protein [Marinomonas communis]|uniref:Antitoxin StbD n=1 Tax=Marinomonas communis TaxID=28254 RepID=A0A4V3DG44_9GAMM|nr:hypothetical protein [Marinomonas communis]TDR12501.1 hypothetical protein C8D85_2536 [Marinomonas communis]
MQSVRLKCIFDALGENSETTENLKRRAELMIRARDLIKNAGGVLVKNDAEQSSAVFTVPTANYDFLMDQLDDLMLENIVQFRRDSEEVEILIDDL